MKKIITYLLLIAFSFSFTEGIFANYTNKNNPSNYTTNNSNVIIYKNGVKINGKYYTKGEFEKLLEKAQKVPEFNRGTSFRAAFLIPAGSYFVPGIGTILVESGKVFIAGTLIAAGSWLHNKVIEYFSSSKSAEQEYNDAKRECKPNKNNNQDSNTDRGWFGEPTGKKAFSTITFFKKGKLSKIRFFDKNGNAELDIDFEHGGKEIHDFPHCHKWEHFSDGTKKRHKEYPCCR